MFFPARRLLAAGLLCLFLLAQLSPHFVATARAFSVGDERKIGEKLLSMVRTEFTLLDDPDITQYIEARGRGILQKLGPQYFDYHFFVINNQEFNAFAAPSGLLFFHSGLIEVMRNEDELFAVLAHEVAHVTSRHVADRIAKNTKASLSTMALVIAGMALGAGPLSEALITGGMAAGASMSLAFSRENEEEADRLAYKWMVEDGRDPQAMVDMMRTMYRLGQYRRGSVPPYLLSHPAPEARMGYIQDTLLIGQERKVVNKDDFPFQRFKRRVLVLSKDPAVLEPVYARKANDPSLAEEERLLARYGLFLVYRATARFALAETEIMQVIRHRPRDPLLLADLGILQFDRGDYAEAEQSFRQALALDAKCGYASYYLARTWQQTGNRKRALDLYQELLEVLPDYSELYYHLGTLYAEFGNRSAGYYYLGMHHWYEGDAKTARYHLERAVDNGEAEDSFSRRAEEAIAKIDELEKL